MRLVQVHPSKGQIGFDQFGRINGNDMSAVNIPGTAPAKQYDHHCMFCPVKLICVPARFGLSDHRAGDQIQRGFGIDTGYKAGEVPPWRDRGKPGADAAIDFGIAATVGRTLSRYRWRPSKRRFGRVHGLRCCDPSEYARLSKQRQGAVPTVQCGIHAEGARHSLRGL